MKKKRSLAVYLVMILVTAISLTSCGKTNKNDSKESEIKKVGFSISTLNNPFFVTLRDAAQEVADNEGVELLVLDAGDNVNKQMTDIEDLIQKKVDVLIVNPTDSDAVVSGVEAANEKGIPVIAIDRSSNGGEIASYIASDNIKGGELAAEYIVDKLGGEGNVIELQGIPGASPTRDRGAGFNKVINEHKDIKILSAQPADFDRAKGLTLMENLLQAHPEIDAVFAHNDEMALGAIEAIKSSGRDIVVVGFDATDDAKIAIDAGDMDATVEEQSGLMGKTGMETAVKIINGEEINKEIPLEVKLITK